MNKVSILTAAAIGLIMGYLLPHPVDQRQPTELVAKRTYRATGVTAPAATILPTPTQAQPGPQLSPGLRQLQQQSSVFDTLHLAFNMAAKADMPTLRELASEASRQADPLYQLHVADIFLERMTAIDPDQALDFAENTGSYDMQTQFIVSVLTSWARSDETAVFAYYQSIDQVELKRRVAATLMRDSSLPQRFLLAVQTELGPYGEQLARSLQQQGQSPEESFFTALNAPGPVGMQQLARSGMRWFRQDSTAALEEVVAMPPSQQRTFLLTNMLSELAGSDPQQAMELVAMYAADNDGAQQSVLYRYAHKDPIAARPYIEAYTERTGNSDAMAELLAGWVKVDPRAATDYAATLPPSVQERSLYNMATAYAEAAPREALEWMLTLDPKSARQIAVYASQSGAAVAAAAQTMLNEVSATADRELLIESVAQYKIQQNPRDAMQWLEQHRDHGNFQQLYSQAMHHLASSNPQQATVELDQRWYEPEMADSFRSIAWSWGTNKPGEAIAWANSLPESAGRSAALGSLVQVVARDDPAQARSLYAKLPEGPDKERAAVTMANQQSAGDPQQMREILSELGLSQSNIDSYMLMYDR